MNTNLKLYDKHKGGSITDERARKLFLAEMPDPAVSFEELLKTMYDIQALPSAGILREVEIRLDALGDARYHDLNGQNAIDLLLNWFDDTGVFDDDVLIFEYAGIKTGLPHSKQKRKNIKQRLERCIVNRHANGAGKSGKARIEPLQEIGRDLAIQICFALKLPSRFDEISQNSWDSPAAVFLRKVGGFEFNARSAWDWVCYFCLYNDKPYKEAVLLYQKYLNETADISAEINRFTVADHGQTGGITAEIRNLFNAGIIEKEDLFYTALRENAEVFTGYRSNNRRKYAELRSTITINYIMWALQHDYYNLDGASARDFARFFLRDNRTAEEYAKRKPRINEIDALWDAIGASCTASCTFLVDFYTDACRILADGDLIQALFLGASCRGFDDEIIKEYAKPVSEVIGFFPRRQYMNKIGRLLECEPDSAISRNMYVLLSVFNEIFRNNAALTNEDDLFDDFERFFAKLNLDLFNCGYAMINVWQRFDWLMLKCLLISLKDGARRAYKYFTQIVDCIYEWNASTVDECDMRADYLQNKAAASARSIAFRRP